MVNRETQDARNRPINGYGYPCITTAQIMTIKYKDDFNIVLNLFSRLVESKAGGRIPTGDAWKNDIQVLALKLIRHLVSMKMVCEGVTIEQDVGVQYDFIDHSSAKVLARASLETFLVFAHIFRETSPPTALFRHRTWHLAGLLDRQGFIPLTQEAHDKLHKERQQIEVLRQLIAEDPLFNKFTENERKKVLKGEWRAGKSWKQLAVAAGLNDSYISQTYSFFCSYSHSSYLSALQVRDARTIAEQEMLSETSIDVANSVLAHFIFTYCNIFPETRAVLDIDAMGRDCAELWHMRSRN
jgi:hypothetical protein